MRWVVRQISPFLTGLAPGRVSHVRGDQAGVWWEPSALAEGSNA